MLRFLFDVNSWVHVSRNHALPFVCFVFEPITICSKTDAEESRCGREAGFGFHFWNFCKSFPAMIPTKMLVYRAPDGATQTEVVPNARRRKKSTGDLFQKGYRVRIGHGQAGDKGEQDSICHSFGACFHVICYWGKDLEQVVSPLKLKVGTSRTLWTLSAGAGSGFAVYYAPHLADACL